MKKVSVVIPAYNEVESIPLIFAEIKSVFSTFPYEWNVVFVDDGSHDNTLNVLQKLSIGEPQLCYIALSRNFGKDNALKA